MSVETLECGMLWTATSPERMALYGGGYQVDVIGYMTGCADLVEASGGDVVFANLLDLSKRRDAPAEA